MQKPVPFLDSSVITSGLLYPESNSGRIRKLTKEVSNVLKRIKDKDFDSGVLNE